jgi:hypothetical protein
VQTIYLDHNIAHYFVRGFPRRDAAVERTERAALAQATQGYPHIRFAVSAWNVIESAAEKEPNSEPEALANRYADFFEALKPLHIPAHDVVEREEMKRCVFEVVHSAGPPIEIPVFNEHLSQVLALTGIGGAIVGYDIRAELLYLCKKQERRESFRKAAEVSRQAREIWLKAKQEGRDRDPAIQKQVLREWWRKLLPERSSDGKFIPLAERERMLDLLTDNPNLVFKGCPAIRVEDSLTDVRANMGGRKPRIEDSMDLMHAIVPLAYCDALVSNDGNVQEGARRVTRKAGHPVVIAARLSDALRVLTAQSTDVSAE